MANAELLCLESNFDLGNRKLPVVVEVLGVNDPIEWRPSI
jgi:hypothetical protein